MSEVKAFLFDLGGVLIHVNSRESILALARDLDVDEATVRSAMTPELLIAYEKGQLDSEEFYSKLRTNSGAGGHLSLEAFRAYWQDVLFPNEVMIAQFKQIVKHFPVWFLSNTNDYHYQLMMEKFPFMSLAQGGTYSFQVEAVKPESEIYTHAIAQTGCAPDELLFIDDLEVNVEGARKAGIPSIQHFTHEQFVSSMKTDYPRTWEQICA